MLSLCIFVYICVLTSPALACTKFTLPKKNSDETWLVLPLVRVVIFIDHVLTETGDRLREFSMSKKVAYDRM